MKENRPEMTPKLYQKTSVIQSTDFNKTLKDSVSIVKRPLTPESYLWRNAELIDCPICGEKTMNHYHYGGVACDSCKAFFRRTAVSPSKKSAKCRTGLGNCRLQMERRNNCPYCRFQKCLRNGMNPGLIKTKRRAPSGDSSQEPPAKVEAVEDNEITPRMFSNFLTNEEKLTQILQYHRLVLSQTDGVNLMTVPDSFIPLIQNNIFLAAQDPNTNDDVKIIAEVEHIFLSVKSNFLRESRDKLQTFISDNLLPSQLFLRVQEILLEFLVRFLEGCHFFQGMPWDVKAKLLRKNITEVALLILLMSYEKKLRCFKFIISNSIVEINEQTLSEYVSTHVAHDIFEFVARFAQLEIPGHVFIILIVICLYSRDGVPMKKQEKIDTARNYYQQLLFRYTKETNPDDQSSRLNATLHRALKTVKDYAENIRSFPVLNNNATININN